MGPFSVQRGRRLRDVLPLLNASSRARRNNDDTFATGAFSGLIGTFFAICLQHLVKILFFRFRHDDR